MVAHFCTCVGHRGHEDPEVQRIYRYNPTCVPAGTENNLQPAVYCGGLVTEVLDLAVTDGEGGASRLKVGEQSQLGKVPQHILEVCKLFFIGHLSAGCLDGRLGSGGLCPLRFKRVH